MTIEDKLRQHAECSPNKTALVCDGASVSYAQLYERVCAKASVLSHQKGRIVPILATPSVDFIETYFALHRARAVAVPLGRDLPTRKLSELSEKFVHATPPAADIADILYTTGTTGKSKGVMVSHAAILSDAENLVEAQGYSTDLTFIINGPLNHIGSLSKLYPTLYVGGTVSIVDGMKDLNRFFEAIAQAETKVATFLVPATIRMLLTFAREKMASYAHKIDFIETGAAPLAQSDMQRLCDVLPLSRLYNTYASTETGIIATFDYNAGECVAGCLGKPMTHSSVSIAADGHIVCRGTTLMSGYWGDEAETQKVLVDGALHTSDIGYMDALGRLRLKGRSGDVINIGGYKVSPVEVEEATLSFPAVTDCVCIAAPHPVVGQVLKLLVVPTEDFDLKPLVNHLKQRLEAYKLPTQYECVASIRRTFNGKIDRKSYAPTP